MACVEVRDQTTLARRHHVVRRSNDCTIDLESKTTSVFARYKIENCVFREPGPYYIELFCEDVFVDDQIILVRPREE
jgi:hypothetical protein